MTKRLFDIIVSTIALLVLAIPMVLIALAIKLTSPGPVFYRGIRTGRYGRPFRIYKFRSMVTNAEAIGGTTTKDGDPRVTKFGEFLRRYKLDELPQLINVLQGDMSFVGPRPEVAEYTDMYTEEEKAILSVRPGITDYSSMEFSDLQSLVGTGDADSVFRHDILPRKNALRLKYVHERSFVTDLKILFQTVVIVLGRPFGWRKRGFEWKS